MIEQYNSQIAVSRYEMECHTAEHRREFERRMREQLVRRIMHHMVEENSECVQYEQEQDMCKDQMIFTARMYLAAEEDYRGWVTPCPPPAFTEADVIAQYEKGVVDTLKKITNAGGEMQDMKLKREQYAGEVLAEVAQEIYMEMLDG